MRFIGRIAIAGAILTAQAADRSVVTVNQVMELVRAGLKGKPDDKGTAKALSKAAPAERLDPVVVEHLESEGAGPRTMEELSRLADETAGLPPPTPPPAFAHPPVPSREEMTAAIRHARVFAANYANSLPDFICDEVVVRYEEFKGWRWEKRDTLGLKLGIEGGKEKDKLVSFNGRSTSRSLESVGGAQTNGEFGGLMFQVLDPASNGKFRWDHWTLLRKRPTQVYSYRIDPRDSRYKLVFGTAYSRVETTPAMEGMLYLDGESNDIVRIANHAADIEPAFPVKQASTILDYAEQEVGGKRYQLPLRAENRMATADIHTRNILEFSAYRKFEGESTITFSDEAPAAGAKIKH